MTTASERAKQSGLKSLKQMSQLSGRDVSTLKNWHNTQPQFFDVVLAGCAAMLENKLSHEWRPLGALLATGYEGRVIYKTHRAQEFTGFILERRVWNSHTVQAIPPNEIAEVLTYV